MIHFTTGQVFRLVDPRRKRCCRACLDFALVRLAPVKGSRPGGPPPEARLRFSRLKLLPGKYWSGLPKWRGGSGRRRRALRGEKPADLLVQQTTVE
jgi:hypothetical protein